MILAKQKSEEAKEREDAKEQDLFSDMAPTIKRQKKVFVGERRGNGAEQGSRLRAVEQDPLVRMMITVMDMMVIVVHQMSAGAELGTWEDGGSSNAAGWQPEDDDLGEVLRWVSKDTISPSSRPPTYLDHVLPLQGAEEIQEMTGGPASVSIVF